MSDDQFSTDWAQPDPPVTRGFVPEGEPATPAERVLSNKLARDRAITIGNIGMPNFIPGDGEEASPAPDGQDARYEAREAAVREAEEAAARRALRHDADEYEAAVRKLNILSARSAIEFIRTLSSRSKRVYARAELEGQARATVLKELKQFLPAESKDSEE